MTAGSEKIHARRRARGRDPLTAGNRVPTGSRCGAIDGRTRMSAPTRPAPGRAMMSHRAVNRHSTQFRCRTIDPDLRRANSDLRTRSTGDRRGGMAASRLSSLLRASLFARRRSSLLLPACRKSPENLENRKSQIETRTCAQTRTADPDAYGRRAVGQGCPTLPSPRSGDDVPSRRQSAFNAISLEHD